MVIFVTLCVMGLALLVMPEVFVALARNGIENPGMGMGLLAVLGLILGWIYRR